MSQTYVAEVWVNKVTTENVRLYLYQLELEIPAPLPPFPAMPTTLFFTSQYGLNVNQLMSAEGGGGCFTVSQAFKWEVLRRHVLFSSSFLFDFILDCFICRPLRCRRDRTKDLEGITDIELMPHHLKQSSSRTLCYLCFPVRSWREKILQNPGIK
jgi:hypothetical protein